MPLDALASIATLTKVATGKAAGICGDDIAVNTKQLLGLEHGREVPAVLKVMRGSLLNKAVLIPVALGVSFFAPWAVLPMLAVGGLHLACEGAQNLLGKGHGHGGHGHGHEGHDHEHDHDASPKASKLTETQKLEKKKIKGALTIDFILSAEITVLTLSIVAGAPLLAQLAVLAGTGLAMTAGMYSLIGGLIKMEDAGKWLARREGKGPVGKFARGLGKALGKSVPPLMKGISMAGTAALFVIGGGLLLHGIPGAGHMVGAGLASLGVPGALQGAAALLAETAVGFAAGFAALPVMNKVEPLVEKAAAACKKQFAKLRQIKVKPAKAQDKKPAPPAPAAAPALKNVPNVKAALQEASQKPANTNTSVAPANTNAPAAPEKTNTPPAPGKN